MRRGVSDRTTAALVTAALIDFGIITADDHSSVVDRQKIRREKEKFRKNINEEEEERISDDVIEGMYFDGKEVETLEVVKEGESYRQQKVKKEHIVIVSQPDGKYLTHVTPNGKAAEPTTNALMEFMDKSGLTEDLKVAGVDSTPLNTGSKGGVLTKLEERRGKKLHWSICDLHTNELGLRHLFETVDGPTSGSNSFKGPIGKSLSTAENLQWNSNFEQISDGPSYPNLSDEVLSDLSTDQKYLFFAGKSVRDG